MKKVLLAFCMLLVGVITSQATSLFPYFGDLVGNYDTLKDSDNQFVAKGVSMLGDIEATESFMADVIPDDVSKSKEGNNVTVYISNNHPEDDVIDTEIRVSAIYLVQQAGGCIVYLTESTAMQQKEYQSEITSGKM